MKETKDDFILFTDDKEFESWAIDETMVLRETAAGHMYADFNFTDDYNSAVKNGKKLCIMDPKSKIMKRGAVTHRVTSKKVKNLERYDY